MGYLTEFSIDSQEEKETEMQIVIQGAGRGIGLAMARQALAAGATQLILTARQPAHTDGIRELPPSDRVNWVKVDFVDPPSITEAAAEIINMMPRIDRLVMAAGVLHDDITKPEKRLSDIDPKAMHYSYQINAIGPMLLVKSLWPALRQPHPLVVASLSARVGSIADNHLGGWYGYRASKAALNQLSHTAAIELARYNPESCMVITSRHCRHRFIAAISKKTENHLHSAQITAPKNYGKSWIVCTRRKRAAFLPTMAALFHFSHGQFCAALIDHAMLTAVEPT